MAHYEYEVYGNRVLGNTIGSKKDE